MPSESLLAGASALALALPLPTTAVSDGIVGGVTCGIIGGYIASRPRAQPRYVAPRRTTRARATTPAPCIRSAQRQENRDVRTALKHFGFDAGSPDGVVGRRMNARVTPMEAFRSIPAGGTLTSLECDVLSSAQTRATSGNPTMARPVSTSPLGARAAFRAQHVMMTGDGPNVAAVHTGYLGLPLRGSGAVDEIAASSEPPAEQLLQCAGFVQSAGLNGDGPND